jgi:hypothetical protein
MIFLFFVKNWKSEDVKMSKGGMADDLVCYAPTSRIAMTYLVASGFTPMNAKGRKTIVLKMYK